MSTVMAATLSKYDFFLDPELKNALDALPGRVPLIVLVFRWQFQPRVILRLKAHNSVPGIPCRN
jgi:hypothetical protein